MTETTPRLQETTTHLREAAISAPQLLQVRINGGISYGAHQVWYPGWIQRMSGCGPTAASNLLWYLTVTRRPHYDSLFDGDGTTQADMRSLMRLVWKYVTPGMRGVDRASILAEGGVRFAADRGVKLAARVLEVPEAAGERPASRELLEFLLAAFADDLPVAFLNLSSGQVRQLDSWHWVTLVGVDSALEAEMYDQGHRTPIDLVLWLETTTGGGAFVVLAPAE